MLPSMFILPAGESRYCIFQASIAQQCEPPVWKFDILENPKYILRNATYMNDYLMGRQQTITHQRVMRTGEIKQYQVVMRRQTSYFSINGIGLLPFYKMTRRIPGLSHKFQKVLNGEDDTQKYHFVMPQPGVLPDLQPVFPSHAPHRTTAETNEIPTEQRIPPHIFQGYIESEIAKGAYCPISLERLSLSASGGAGVAALPCGHLFQRTALVAQLSHESSTPLCAVCRTPFTPSSIYTV